MNQFLVITATEKIAVMQTEAFFSEQQSRVDREEFWRILNRAGGEAPHVDDVIEAAEP